MITIENRFNSNEIENEAEQTNKRLSVARIERGYESLPMWRDMVQCCELYIKGKVSK